MLKRKTTYQLNSVKGLNVIIKDIDSIVAISDIKNFYIYTFYLQSIKKR